MNVPVYAREQVSYWENSALDSRIYLVEQEPDADLQPSAADAGPDGQAS